jgi:hypothetical protein
MTGQLHDITEAEQRTKWDELRSAFWSADERPRFLSRFLIGRTVTDFWDRIPVITLTPRDLASDEPPDWFKELHQ